MEEDILPDPGYKVTFHKGMGQKSEWGYLTLSQQSLYFLSYFPALYQTWLENTLTTLLASLPRADARRLRKQLYYGKLGSHL